MIVVYRRKGHTVLCVHVCGEKREGVMCTVCMWSVCVGEVCLVGHVLCPNSIYLFVMVDVFTVFAYCSLWERIFQYLCVS